MAVVERRRARFRVTVNHGDTGTTPNFPWRMTEAQLLQALQGYTDPVTGRQVPPAQMGGGDIMVALNSDGTGRLPVDIELFNTSTVKASIWVKQPAMTNSSFVWVFFDSPDAEVQPAADSTYGSQEVWKGAGFDYLSLDGGATDRTGNGYNDWTTNTNVPLVSGGPSSNQSTQYSSNSVRTISTNAVYSGLPAGGNARIIMWIKPTTAPTENVVLYQEGGSFNNFSAYLGADLRPVVNLRDANKDLTYKANSVLPLNNWSFINASGSDNFAALTINGLYDGGKFDGNIDFQSRGNISSIGSPGGAMPSSISTTESFQGEIGLIGHHGETEVDPLPASWLPLHNLNITDPVGFATADQAQDLTGTPVAELPYAIVALMGQSNPQGTAAAGAQDVDVSGIAQFTGNPNISGFGQISTDITPLHHPRPSSSPASPDNIGTGDYFFRQIFTNGLINPTTHRLLIVPCARGSTGMITGDQEWKPTAPLGELMQNAIDQCSDAVAAAKAINSESYFAGILWGQGENETNNGGDQDAYMTAFIQLRDLIRTNVDTATDCWTLIGSMVPDWVKTKSNGQAIQGAHMRLAFENDAIHFDQAQTGLEDTSNPVHYDAEGYRSFGAQMGDNLKVYIDDPRLEYNFVGDNLGDGATTPILGAESDIGTTNMIIRDGSSVGLSGKCLSAEGSGSLASINSAGLVFSAVHESTTDIYVEFNANFVGRQSITLRAETSGTYTAPLGYSGYLFRIDADKTISLFSWDGSTFSHLTGVSQPTGVSGSTARFRFSAIGNTLTIEVSENEGITWSTIWSGVDSDHTSGGVCYMQGGNGSNAGTIFADNFQFRRPPTATNWAIYVGSLGVDTITVGSNSFAEVYIGALRP